MFLKPGDRLQPVVKAQGIKKGEHVEKIGGPIEVVSLGRERMSDFRQRQDSHSECVLEGFPEMTADAFYQFFRGTHADSGRNELQETRLGIPVCGRFNVMVECALDVVSLRFRAVDLDVIGRTGAAVQGHTPVQ